MSFIGKTLIAAILLSAVVAGYFWFRSDGPSYPRPWAAYAFNVGRNELELINGAAEYADREDCMHEARQEVEFTSSNEPVDKFLSNNSSPEQIFKEPYGCLYDGYQNRYVQYLVNMILNRSTFKCIMKVTDDDTKQSGLLYYPALPMQMMMVKRTVYYEV
jgi:hypothetical protein